MEWTWQSFSAEAYTADLPAVTEAIEANIGNHGSVREYLAAKRDLFTSTELYIEYKAGIHRIGGEAIARTGLHTLRNLMETTTLLSDPDFDDGFTFGMLVNNRLLGTRYEEWNMDALNELQEATQNFLGGLEEIVEQGDAIDKALTTDGQFYFDHNLAHPDEKDSEEINKEGNVLRYMAKAVASNLYFGTAHGRAPIDTEAQQARADRFEQGFGIARSIYTDYRMNLDLRLQEAFDATPSIDDDQA